MLSQQGRWGRTWSEFEGLHSRLYGLGSQATTVTRNRTSLSATLSHCIITRFRGEGG